MNGMGRNFNQNSWNSQHDLGLDLYCDIEGVDRCTLLNHTNLELSRRTAPHLHLNRSNGHRAGFAAMLMLVIKFFSRS